MALLDSRSSGWRGAERPTLGVVSPFRAQADALEAIRDRWTAEEIGRVRLRVGTVHAFQGAERDVVLLSLAVVRRRGPDLPPGPQPVQRARHPGPSTHGRGHLVPGPPPGSCDYLRWTGDPPGPMAGEPARRADLGLGHRRGGGPPGPVGCPCRRATRRAGSRSTSAWARVRPSAWSSGSTRVARLPTAAATSPCRAGWRLVDAFPARFDDDPVAAALDLATRAGRTLE